MATWISLAASLILLSKVAIGQSYLMARQEASWLERFFALPKANRSLIIFSGHSCSTSIGSCDSKVINRTLSACWRRLCRSATRSTFTTSKGQKENRVPFSNLFRSCRPILPTPADNHVHQSRQPGRQRYLRSTMNAERALCC